MPVYTAGFVVRVATPAKAAALRDKVAAYIQQDPDVTLISWSASRDQHTYTVWGVDTSTGESFTETKEADDEPALRALYSSPKVIAHVVRER
jgi:hypothetical protein